MQLNARASTLTSASDQPISSGRRRTHQEEVRESIADFAPESSVSRWLAEAFGTFAITFVDGGGAIIASFSSDVTPSARAAAAGLTIMAMAFAISNVSGAHFNPAVTFAFALRRAFPWRLVPHYWLAQIAGAVLAATTLRFLFGPISALGTTHPEHGQLPGFVVEIVLACLLCFVVLSTATRHKVVGPIAPFAAGGTVALCALFARPVSGASMNPARSLGPALVTGHLHDAWVYMLAPIVGALIAAALVEVVHRRHHRSELEAAMGRS